VTYTLGSRKAKNWLTPGRRIAQTRPTSQARKVDAGIVGSSVLATADRTSAYGDSSCTIESVGSKLGSSMSMPCMVFRHFSYIQSRRERNFETLSPLMPSTRSRTRFSTSSRSFLSSCGDSDMAFNWRAQRGEGEIRPQSSSTRERPVGGRRTG
jgi:hypothetical protein